MVKKSKPKANTMWGGHYSSGPAETMARINASIDVDKKLYKQDIAASLAHSAMLEKQGILTKAEAAIIQKGLRAIEKEIASGKMKFSSELEDIHMHVESRLKEIIGDVAGKLHTARSRNDQAVTDFRLWIRDAIDSLDGLLKDLLSALLDRAEEHAGTIMPGFTHLQVAQPVTLGHHLMAYVEMLARDRARLGDARKRLNECPLGACALAGTSFPVDRKHTASALGFDRPTNNSMDSVSARDFALEFLSVAAICSQHLSRLAEEFILWSSTPFGFISFSEEFTSGSSIMPQKRNPDGAELVRGKAGRVNGALITLLTVTKGLPLAYNKDLQEDKEPVIDAADTLMICLSVMAGMMRDFKANTKRMRELADTGFSTATDLADWLVQNLNIPFRDAHHITGKVVKLAETKGCKLHDISLKELTAIHPGFTQQVYSALTVESSVKSRTSFGGTAPANVKRAIKLARREYL